MIQMLIHEPATCLIALLSLVALTLVANRLGLIACLAWLDRGKEDRGKEDRREEKRRGEGTREYRRIHR